MKLAEIFRREVGLVHDFTAHAKVNFIRPPKKRLKIKRAWKQSASEGGETLWLANPTSTPCSSCGY